MDDSTFRGAVVEQLERIGTVIEAVVVLGEANAARLERLAAAAESSTASLATIARNAESMASLTYANRHRAGVPEELITAATSMAQSLNTIAQLMAPVAAIAAELKSEGLHISNAHQIGVR